MLRRFRDLPEAAVVKTILDAEGIDCILSDENLVRMDWFWSNLLGGVKLWVKQQDVDEAQNLIDLSPLEKWASSLNRSAHAAAPWTFPSRS
jgi:hypothetical protein